MRHFPDFDTFRRLAHGVHLVPVFRRLTGDTLTPVSAFHKIDSGSCACLFESVIGGEKVGRYSFLTASPFLHLEAHGSRVRVTWPADADRSEEFESADPLAELKTRVEAWRAATLPELPPFCSGAVGYAGYDTVRYVENLPNAPTDDRGLPDLSFAFFDHMVVFDNITKTMTVVAMARLEPTAKGAGLNDADLRTAYTSQQTFDGENEVDLRTAYTSQQAFDHENEVDLRTAYEDACRRVDLLVDQLEATDKTLQSTDLDTLGNPPIKYQSNFSQADFEAAVEKCQEYIRAGDIFQVVLSQRMETTIAAPPFEIYRTLRVVNPSPFMFYLRLPGVTLVGSSPEIMVRVVNGKVTVRPLAGTRRRGESEEEDRRLAEELLADPKERAEHVMLVDLGRNDVGRVARYGSVEVTDVMTIERYSHVMHITSNVNGQLAAGRDAFDALKACLPAGTVSGAPKVRAMEIIDEFEPHRRGPYAGAVGYFDFNGNMDTCIALRTIVVQDDKAYVQAGAGIVADSVPASEYQETLNKARGLLKAIAMTESRVSEGT